MHVILGKGKWHDAGGTTAISRALASHSVTLSLPARFPAWAGALPPSSAAAQWGPHPLSHWLEFLGTGRCADARFLRHTSC